MTTKRTYLTGACITGLLAAACLTVPGLAGDRASLSRQAPVDTAARTEIAAKASGESFVNPHVQPGSIRWHGSFQEACQAAKKSHKPVLLFYMMGKLDDLFC